MKKTCYMRAIVFALFALFAIVLIMMQLQRTKPTPPAVLKKLPLGERVAIVDSSYINLPFLFIWTMPNDNWRMQVLSQDTVLTSLQSNSSMLSSIKWLVGAARLLHSDSLAVCRLGAFENSSGKSAFDLAVDMLAELLQEVEKNGDRALILQPVTKPAHHVLKGAYFVIVNSQEPDAKVLLFALLPREKNIFVLHCRATRENYDLLRPEWQTLVQRFFPLPKTHSF